MHILIIASWYKKSLEEINAPFIEEQARMLLKAGMKVSVFYPHFIGGFKDRLRKNKKQIYHFIDNGLPTWYYGEMSIVPYFRKYIYRHLCKNAEKVYLEYVNENGKPDVFHAHSVFMGGIAAMYLSNKYKVPYFITEHASKLIMDFDLFITSDKKYIRKVMDNSSRTIFVSLFQQDKMKIIYNLKSSNKKVIPNVLNSIFQYRPIITSISQFTIVVTGALIIRKNHILLFEAIKILKDKEIDCRVKVIGEGEADKEIMQYVNTNGIEKNIEFLGSLSRESVFKQLISCHCLVSTSKIETFGINLIEALAVGRPVIATNSGGPKEIITEKNGILLKTFEADELVTAINYLIDNYQKYNLKEISDDCMEKYSETKIAAELKNLYKETYIS